MVDGVYVLNLREAVDRKEALTELLERQKLLKITNWVTAIDGDFLFGEVSKDKVIPEYSFPYHSEVWLPEYIETDYNLVECNKTTIMASGKEVAIGLGHLKMWEAFLASDAKHALFLEDDAYFKDTLKYEIKYFLRILPEDWDMVYLDGFLTPSARTSVCCRDVDRIDWGILRLSGYMLSRSGAKKLLEGLPIIGAVDIWANYQFKDMNVFRSTARLVSQNRWDFQSTNTWSFMDKFPRKSKTTTTEAPLDAIDETNPD